MAVEDFIISLQLSWTHYRHLGGGVQRNLVYIENCAFHRIGPRKVSMGPNTRALRNQGSVTGIPGRNVRIFLPRGYAENTSRRYPVVYFHDGQNVFFPGANAFCAQLNSRH